MRLSREIDSIPLKFQIPVCKSTCVSVVYFLLPDTHTHTHAGQEPSDQVVDSMMSEAPGPLNFTMFLTLFGEKLNG